MAFRISRRCVKSTLLASAFAGALAAPSAHAQTRTFHLDRLQPYGAPEDTLFVSRPYATSRATVYAQATAGYSFRPLHTSNMVVDNNTLARSSSGVVDHQLNTYLDGGISFLDRFTLGLGMTLTPWQAGQNPNYGSTNLLGNPATTTVEIGGPATADLRVDGRAVAWRSDDRRSAAGVNLSVFAPTGSKNFGGDGSTGVMLLATGETHVGRLIVAGNIGPHLRPVNSINSPSTDKGLGVGNELRYAGTLIYPWQDGRYRLGLSLLGQTGIENGGVVGNTLLNKRNTSLEWAVEGRTFLGSGDRWYASASAGTQILNGYGAPDFRGVLAIGAYVPMFDTDPVSPEVAEKRREDWRRGTKLDSDGDGLTDDVDPCPNQAEDGKQPSPNDGCPMGDKDGDGILDADDKCPGEAEDKDGIDDLDGCPEDDFDQDTVPDVTDACPKEPGKASEDAKKNGCPQFISREGGKIRIFQQVHFATGSAKVLPDSFPMLQEIADVLRTNPSIKKMGVEGHTDNKGKAALNKKLSQDRAASVVKWIADHGVESSRLEARGYGQEQPVADNNTNEGRTQNRRVDFKILVEE